MKKLAILGVIAMAVACVGSAFGTTWYVSPTGDGTDPSAGFATGYATIKAALNNTALADGDTILLDKCTFDMGYDGKRGDISTSADAIKKSITISGAGTKEETILDGGREWNRRNSGQDKFYPQFVVSANGVTLRNMTLERMGSNGNPAIQVNNNYTDCVISNIIVRNSGWGYTELNGGSGYVTTGSKNTRLTHCIFTNNIYACSIVYLSGSTDTWMENCYVADNKCTGWSSGTVANGVVYAAAGSYLGKGGLRNNTIVNNKSLMGALCHDGYSNCRIVNNIISGNTDLDGVGPKDVYQKTSATSLWTYNCVGEGSSVYTGAGNIFANPGLADDNMHLKAGSLCIGAATPSYAPAYDIDGVARDPEKPSMGCCEYVGSTSFTCAIVPSASPYVSQPSNITLSVTFEGEPVAPLTYAWDLTGDGEPDSYEAMPILSEVGEYTVSVLVTDANGTEASAVVEGKLYVYPVEKTFYVVPNNAGAKSPYTTWETAAKTLADAHPHAFKFANSKVILSDGDHTVSSKLVLTNGMTITSLNGQDATTIVSGMYGDASMFEVNDPNATIEKLTIKGRNDKGSWVEGACVYLKSGVLRDCVVTGWGAGSKGTISTTGCTAARPSRIERCVIANCRATQNGAVPGVFFAGSGATMENCLLTNLVTTYKGGYSWNLGSAFNCSSGQTVIRNCTIANSDCLESYPLHFVYAPAVFENNVVYGNTTNGTFAANDLVLKDVFNKDLGVVSTVAYTCVTAGERDYSKNIGIITATPGFVDAVNGDYHLLRNDSFTSPCIGKGNNGAYTAESIDLDGNKRIVGRRVDMGCYECQTEYGTQMIVR